MCCVTNPIFTESPAKYPPWVLNNCQTCQWGLWEICISYAIRNMLEQLVLPIPSATYF